MARSKTLEATQILRAGNFAEPIKNASLVMGDRGKAVLWARSARRPRPPAILWFLSHRWERNSPCRANPCEAARPKKEIRNLPPHPPPSGAPIPIPSVALRHLPLIRGVGPPRGRLFLGGETPPHPPHRAELCKIGRRRNSHPSRKTFRLFPPAVL